MDTYARVRMHRALADRHRLTIVDALRVGDRTPQELSEVAEIPTNLLAHHLQVLEEAEMIERRVSTGDKRRRYVALRPDRLVETPPESAVISGGVLFVCTHNSARSQFAAALWHVRTGGPSDSAGSNPATRVDARAVAAAAHAGIAISAATPKGYEAVDSLPTLVVSVCDRARESGVPFEAPTLHWSVPDPIADGRPEAFSDALAEISERVDRLATALERH
jgi:ArsR family transcriptional regulator, arsenate/arsenite/antimonite-responsive transcriptional repressor / arsenate reductase (thioredoxin)